MLSTKKTIKNKRRFFLFFLVENVFSSFFLDRFLGRKRVFLFSYFLVFFYKFPPLVISLILIMPHKICTLYKLVIYNLFVYQTQVINISWNKITRLQYAFNILFHAQKIRNSLIKNFCCLEMLNFIHLFSNISIHILETAKKRFNARTLI